MLGVKISCTACTHGYVIFREDEAVARNSASLSIGAAYLSRTICLQRHSSPSRAVGERVLSEAEVQELGDAFYSGNNYFIIKKGTN
ncbi:hypothetical protein PsorP6_016052 [Peronosclerospora sorghi]|uniref:Uncharacterized protein n=1 Tax=Peronosclerospora sorghi TaxID=230839 RepID=A0ACC0WMI1_9STRA|nr:hypothetical protein PsorP6_016052 [Peronosclerospora sorghi]